MASTPDQLNLTIQEILGSSDSIAEGYLQAVYPALANLLSPAVYSLAIIFWAIYGFQVYSGHKALNWFDVFTRIFMTFLVFLTLSWNGFAFPLYKMLTEAINGISATIMAGEETENMLDALITNVGSASVKLQKADWMQIGVILLGVMLFLANCILFIVALYNMTIAKFGLAIMMSLLPIFIGFSLFQQTRQYALNCINKILNFALIYILVIAIVRFGFVAFSDTIAVAKDAGQSMSSATITIKHILGMYVLEGIMILFMLQVKSWAAALTNTATVQGVTVVKNLIGR